MAEGISPARYDDRPTHILFNVYQEYVPVPDSARSAYVDKRSAGMTSTKMTWKATASVEQYR